MKFEFNWPVAFLTIWATSHMYFGTCTNVYAPFCKYLLVPSLQINQFLKIQVTRTPFQKPIIEEDSAYRVLKY